MSDIDTSKAAAWASQADKARALAFGARDQALGYLRSVLSVRDTVQGWLATVGFAHRWNGTRLDIMGPDGAYIEGPDLKGEAGQVQIAGSFTVGHMAGFAGGPNIQDIGAPFSGAYADLSGKPTLGTSAAHDATDFQPSDATLTAIAALDATAGLIEQTGADTFARRALGVGAGTSVPTRADADTRYIQATALDTDATLAANSDAKVASQKAIKAFVNAAVAALVNSSPAALDTLKELADAIGDDANFAATMTTALASKLAKAGDAMTGALGLNAWQDVASAATTDIGAATSNLVRITGTVGATSLGTAAAGTWRLCRFAAAMTLTHNATSLILPGAANITTAADARMVAVSLGSGNWIVLVYQRADGKAIVAPAFSEITSKPTTLSGYGITDAEPLGQVGGINTQTANYTLALTDAGNMVEMNVASANTLTVPPNSAVAFPIKTRIELSQYGAGQTSVAAGVGVTIRSDSGKLKIGVQYGGGTLYKRGTDEWVLIGNLSA